LHGLADREPQACIANGIEEEAVTGDELRQLRRWYLAEAADILRAHPYDIEWNVVPDFLVYIEAKPAAPALDVVDDDDALLPFARVARIGRNQHAVLDDACRRPVVVPHHPVEVGDMDDEHVRVIDEM